MLPEHLSFGTIDGLDAASELGFVLSRGSDTFKAPNQPKEGYSYRWEDDDGIEFDLTSPVYKEARTFLLEGWLIGDSIEDFDAKYETLKDLLFSAGARSIFVKKYNLTVEAKIKSFPKWEVPAGVYRDGSTFVGSELSIELVEVMNASDVPLPPLVYSGGSRTITLPTTSLAVSGAYATPRSGSTIETILWEFVSSGTGITPGITNPGTLTPTLTGMTVAGTYIFRLSATDSNDLTSTSNKTITVQPEGTGPGILPYSLPFNL